MRYFSTFSGIGGFELGIQNAYGVRDQVAGDIDTARLLPNNSGKLLQEGRQRPVCVGYSEIDKYASSVYEYNFRQPKSEEELQADLDSIKTILENQNYDIMEICYVNTVESGLTSIKTTNQSVKSALESPSSSGDKTIKKLINATNESLEVCLDKKCLICMGMSAPAAEKVNISSSHLNTEMVMATSIEKNTELAICINSPSKFTTQKNMKSCATTVITQKGDMAYVHISRTKPVRNFGDITKINADELPDFDCLVGGFPCQAFSIAGKRHGFEDTRGTLFFDLARILQAKRPRLFVFENVKGLLNHDSGNTFKTIIAAIDELGYDCQWQVLNSKNHGVPQNRERVIIVGHLRGTPRPQVFPIIGTNSQDIIVSGVLDTETWRKRYEQIRRVHSPDGISPTIPTGTGGGVMTKIGVRAVLTPDRTEKKQNGRRIKDDGEPSFTLTAQDKHGILVDHGATRKTENSTAIDANYYKGFDNHGQRTGISDGLRIRRLTPLECERLQGFPDNWTAIGVNGPISDSQRYKMCGNAVTTNVICDVFTRIFT